MGLGGWGLGLGRYRVWGLGFIGLRGYVTARFLFGDATES